MMPLTLLIVTLHHSPLGALLFPLLLSYTQVTISYFIINVTRAILPRISSVCLCFFLPGQDYFLLSF